MKLGQTSVVHFLSQIGTTIVGAAATIYLANELGPNVLGTYYLVIAVLVWAQLGANMGIQSAVTKRVSESSDGGGYIAAGLTLQTGLLTVVALGLFGLRGHVNDFIGARVTVFLVLLLGVQVSFNFVIALLRGHHLVQISSSLKPVERSVRSIIQITLVFSGMGIIGLLIGPIIAGIIGTLVGVTILDTTLSRPSREQFSEIYEYARFSWLGQLTGNTFNSVDTLLLGVFVSTTLVGVYEISWNIASLLAIFGTSIVQTLFPEMSRLSSEGDLDAVEDLVNKSLTYAGVFTIPGIVGATLLGEVVLSIYGDSFRIGHQVLIVLVGARLVFAYESQYINALDSLDRPDISFRINSVFIVADVVLNLVLIPIIGWIGAAVGTAVSAIIALYLSHRELTKIIDVMFPAREIGYQIVASGVMAIGVILARLLVPDSLIFQLVLIGFGAGLYFLVLLGISAEFRSAVVDNLPHPLTPQ